MGITGKEGGQKVFGGDLFNVTLHLAGDLAAADGVARWKCPTNCTIIDAQMTLNSNGGNSAATTVTLSIGAVDLNSSAGSIAHDEATLQAAITLDTQNTVDEDDLLEVDIDAVPPDTAPTDLTIHLLCARRLVRSA